MYIFKRLVVVFLFAGSSAVLAADTNGTITINGIVPSEESIVVVDAGTVLNPLGAGYANENVGSITLNSNNPGGFTVTFTSVNTGDIAQGPLATERIAYTLDLTSLDGNLGSGITEPTLAGIDPDGGILVFTGAAAEPTVGAAYDVGVNTLVRGDLIPGDGYTDTLTITISTL